MGLLQSYFSAYFSAGVRDRRVFKLIATLWVLSLADLVFTLWAHFFTPFQELNPLARYFLLQNLIPSLVLFKLVVTTIGASIFWRLRQHPRAEAALWAIVGVYIALAFRWSSYTTAAMALGGGGGAFHG
ncbi:MAG: DUF5658 family protein [Phycisphaerae bacterium]|nr:DUF5658 family protein [Tepidisphaeraceae bacterium]